MYIKGVNLGNWLVLEKWMSPVLFEGTTAENEHMLPEQLSREVYEARIRVHRREYILERDFASIRRMGMNAVRIPVPYFIFGDRPPFLGCVEELDRAFSWAEKYGLKVLIDLHTAPLGQNDFDNGGICGVCRWSQTPEEVAYVLEVLERFAKRYGQKEALFGIEPINEPITKPMWDLMDVPSRYPAVDRELAEGSAPNTLEFLRQFYEDAYDRLRSHMARDKWVVFHDGFQMKAWKDFLTRPEFRNVMLDTHLYLMTAEQKGCEQSVEGYTAYIEEHYAADIRGPWSEPVYLHSSGYDPKAGQIVGYPRRIWRGGTDRGCIEAPHLTKRGTDYYKFLNTRIPVDDVPVYLRLHVEGRQSWILQSSRMSTAVMGNLPGRWWESPALTG